MILGTPQFPYIDDVNARAMRSTEPIVQDWLIILRMASVGTMRRASSESHLLTNERRLT